MVRLIRAPICRAANKHASLPLHAPRALKRLKPLTQRASPARIKRRTGSRSKVFDLDQTARLPFCMSREVPTARAWSAEEYQKIVSELL
jgi:hypothetical protein